jgi:hypothetical protein
MIRIEHDVETGAVTEVTLTAAELKEKEKDAALTAEKIAIKEAAELTKATEKAALLAKLGITDDEAKLLLS